jgi:hypothetical protein
LIYDAVGVIFLLRLAKTKSVQPLALNIISTFSQHPDICGDFAGLAPVLLELVLTVTPY